MYMFNVINAHTNAVNAIGKFAYRMAPKQP